jgi:nucleolar protein 56
LRYFLVVNELGLILADDKKENAVFTLAFPAEQRTKRFVTATSGELSDEEVSWLKSKITQNDQVIAEAQLIHSLLAATVKSEAVSEEDLRGLSRKRIELIVSSGLAPSSEAAQEAIRNASLEMSNIRIKELSARPDLQAVESVQALDEIDRAANMIASRVREWYGLHFPELVSMVDDNSSLIKIIFSFKSRDNYDENELEQMGYSKNKSRAIALASKESKGADIREEDLSRIIQLAEEAQHLFSVRDKLANHVERTMRQVAPNVSELAGASIGARLIAKAGGLEKLAILPASTIQILGAEKALYRALKSGSRPPKHGILFQHAAVHSAPKWQRGKIARSIAGKIAIAARIDQYRGTKEPSVEQSLALRLNEIKTKYKEAPKEMPQFVPQRFKEGEPAFEEQRSKRKGKPRPNLLGDRSKVKRLDRFQRKNR